MGRAPRRFRVPNRTGRGAGRRAQPSQAVRLGPVAPACALVQEAMSATLDEEATPLTMAEIDRHLALCSGCRAFSAGASALSAHAAAPEAPSAPTRQMLAIVATARRGTRAGPLAEAIVRLRTDSRRPGWCRWRSPPWPSASCCHRSPSEHWPTSTLPIPTSTSRAQISCSATTPVRHNGRAADPSRGPSLIRASGSSGGAGSRAHICSAAATCSMSCFDDELSPTMV